MKNTLITLVACIIAQTVLSQNIGIGTSTPAGKLQINHRATPEVPTLQLFDSSVTDAGSIYFLNASGSRRWQLSNYINNFSRANQYMYIGSDSSNILTLRANGNVGINNNAPDFPLDVNGSINLTGPLHINGTAGNAGQVLKSNGAADPEWKSTSFDNNVRFSSRIPQTNFNAPLTYTTHYNNSPSDIVIGPNNIIINKSGLYHIEGYLNINLVFSATPSIQHANVSLQLDGEPYSVADTEPLNVYNSTALQYKKVFRFEQEVYITAPATIAINKGISYGVAGSLTTEQYSGKLTGYLISE